MGQAQYGMLGLCFFCLEGELLARSVYPEKSLKLQLWFLIYGPKWWIRWEEMILWKQHLKLH